MDKPKTATELHKILMDEMKASVKGQRVIPFDIPVDIAKQIELNDPIAAMLGVNKLASIGLYHSFKESVQKYQIDNQISCLEWVEINIDGNTLKYPEPVDQLIPLNKDLLILAAARDKVVNFWLNYCRENLVYVSRELYANNNSEWSMETTAQWVSYFSKDMEWAMVSDTRKSKYGNQGLSLKLGYGNPYTADFVDDKTSESFWFDASICCHWFDMSTLPKAEKTIISLNEVRNIRKKQSD